MRDWLVRDGRIAIVLLLVAMLLAACGGGGEEAAVSTEPSGDVGTVGQAEDASSAGPEAQAPGAAEEPAGVVGDATGAQPGQPATTGAGNGQGSVTGQAPPDRMVIQTASLDIRVEDVGAALARAQQVAESYGGYILKSEKRQQGEQTVADLTVSVPQENFVAALDDMRGLGKEVVSESTNGQDVTEQYVDLQARQRTLEATEKSLLALLGEADDINEILTVRDRITAVQTELEQVKGRMQYLEHRSEVSQIALSIRPVVPEVAPAEPAPEWSPLRVAERAWNASMRVLQVVASAAITVVVFGWWLLPLLAAGLLAWRRNTRRVART